MRIAVADGGAHLDVGEQRLASRRADGRALWHMPTSCCGRLIQVELGLESFCVARASSVSTHALSQAAFSRSCMGILFVAFE